MMVKLFKTGDFSLLTHTATQVQDVEPEIRHTFNSAATKIKLSTYLLNNHIFGHTVFSLNALVLC